VITSRLLEKLPLVVRARVEKLRELATDTGALATGIENRRVLGALAPSAIRGLVLGRGHGASSDVQAHHKAKFDWQYERPSAELRDLYRRAKRSQWDSDELAWATSVDPRDPEVPLLRPDFLAFDALADKGVTFGAAERRAMLHDVAAWMLSQFLHGEQGALLAAAQVTEAMPSLDAKSYGATQVMDEARHVEVFHRYVTEKLENLVRIDDNLYVVIDALMTDARWDVKCLGMQIMVEGLAVGAFGTMYRSTREPLLRELLRRVIRDETRHVRFGVVALRDHIRDALDDRERREREDWAFEVSRMMRDRFMMFEIYEQHASHRVSRTEWRELMAASPGMREFHRKMFSRLMPNLRAIGLLGPRMLERYRADGILGLADESAWDDVTETHDEAA